MATFMETVDAVPIAAFMDQVIQRTPGDSRLSMCIQCGTCGGSCPSAEDMDHTPRQIFAMIRANMKERVLRSNTPWFCVSCYYCMVRCPQEVHIPDVMYTLKHMAIEAGLVQDNTAPDLSNTFVHYVENNGRSFEFGLATRHYLKHQPLSLMGKAAMGLEMFSKGRMDWRPEKIRNTAQLHAILDRAKEIETTAEQAPTLTREGTA